MLHTVYSHTRSTHTQLTMLVPTLSVLPATNVCVCVCACVRAHVCVCVHGGGCHINITLYKACAATVL